ncbi:MAG: hypothetical protein MUF34_27605 [Polyangiaceae bacterium]|nr:hypothetical protein [Polyangiaceae bacterium]
MRLRRWFGAALVALVGAGCGDGESAAPLLLPTPGPVTPGRVPPPARASWHVVARDEAGALLSVGGTSERDVWAVGADKGAGPSVLHFDGASWRRLDSGHRGDLWWVHAADDGRVYFAGAGGAVLRYAEGRFERLPTPGLGKQTAFGVWASAGGKEVWVVGGAAGRDGFVWRRRGEGPFEALALPLAVPRRGDGELPALLKVWGDGAGDVWLVGDRGTALRSRDGGPLDVLATGTRERLFAAHGAGGDVVAVGGTGRGVVLEGAGPFAERAPEATPLLQGVHVSADGEAWAVGQRGTVLRRAAGVGWASVDHGLDLSQVESLHAVWRDPQGGVWAVGGNVLSPRLDGGIVVHLGGEVPSPSAAPAPPAPTLVCPDVLAPDQSIARAWNEQALAAIRRDLPRPGVHARNLFHLAAALWDAWSAFEPAATGYLVREKIDPGDDAEGARREALSYAALRVLTHRYRQAVGGEQSAACFQAAMRSLGFDPDDAAESGAPGRALGNRIGRAYVEAYASDGANEAADYADTTGFVGVNPPLAVDEPGAGPLVDLGQWQPLNLSVAATQNGIVLPAGVQGYLGAHWGEVRPFALDRPAPGALYVDPGPGPGADPSTLRVWALEVLRRTSQLDEASGETIDTSPRTLGGNSLGADDGTGYAQNPVTGAPYAPAPVPLGDFGRVLAEHWADGPASETPPGHWNVIANRVADDPAFERRLFGEGAPLDRLAWDVTLYFTLNGALHDAAVAAWELKRRDVAVRPITLLRHFAERGQSSDPARPHYAPDGLPLVEGLVELVTEASVASGRHAHLAHFVGELAVRSWRGEPGDRARGVGGIGWVRGLDWLPYQRRSFVTPAFPGFVSGHSTFSRAAAEVLAALTGSPYFPGGFAEFVAERNAYLTFERGPSQPVRLQWASYYDAADQAGQSRLWGGIHITPDDHAGRRVGQRVGLAAIEKARAFFRPDGAR